MLSGCRQGCDIERHTLSHVGSSPVRARDESSCRAARTHPRRSLFFYSTSVVNYNTPPGYLVI